jgi:hypothetical protein
MPLVKEDLSSNMPRSQARYLFEVTRLTVDSCMPIASATVSGVSGRRCAPRAEEAVLLLHDLGRHLDDRPRR